MSRYVDCRALYCQHSESPPDMNHLGRLTLKLPIITLLIVNAAVATDFQRSYAVVVGIDAYSSSRWHRLSYARKDGKGVADYLKSQGYLVSELYDQQATKHDIFVALHS